MWGPQGRPSFPGADLLDALLGNSPAHDAPASPWRPQPRPPSLADYLADPDASPQVAAAASPPPALPALRVPDEVARMSAMRRVPGHGAAPQLEGARRSRFLAQGVVDHANEQARRGPPPLSERRVGSVDMQTTRDQFGVRSRAGQVNYEERPRPFGSVLDDVEQRTGVPSHYLNALIEHESGGDDHAKAETSSATGPAQFIDSTWLRMMRQYGPEYGLPANASDAELLELRTSRNWAALMAAEYANENRQVMSAALSRPITEGEAYLGHFLGAEDAAELIAAADHNLPDARRFVSRGAVEANRTIFFHPNGRPRSAREVVQLQTRRFRRQPLTERGP